MATSIRPTTHTSSAAVEEDRRRHVLELLDVAADQKVAGHTLASRLAQPPSQGCVVDESRENGGNRLRILRCKKAGFTIDDRLAMRRDVGRRDRKREERRLDQAQAKGFVPGRGDSDVGNIPQDCARVLPLAEEAHGIEDAEVRRQRLECATIRTVADDYQAGSRTNAPHSHERG